MTIPGIDAVTAALAAVIGDVRRFPTSRRLVGYRAAPDDPPVGQRPSASRPPLQGGLSRRSPCAGRGGVVGREGTGPLRAFAERTAARRGRHVATVATSRASSPSSRGTCCPAARTTPSRGQASCAASCARWSSRPARHAPSPAPIRPDLEHHRRCRREAPRAAGRGRLPALGHRLAGQWPKGGCGRDTGARIS